MKPSRHRGAVLFCDDQPATAARARALVAAGCFAAGIWAAGQGAGGPGSAALASAAIAAAGLSMAVSSAPARSLCLAVAVALLGAGWYAARNLEAPADSALWRLPADTHQRHLIAVEARLLEDPILQPAPPTLAFARPAQWTVPIQAIAIRDDTGWTPASGTLRLVVTESPAPADLRAGDHVTASGWSSRRQGPMNPGSPGADRLGLPLGVLGSLHAPSSELVERIEHDAGPRDRAQRAWLRWRADARAYLLTAMGARSASHDPASDGPAAMLAAIALGQRDYDSETEQAFRRVGLAHLMAISGLHLAILIGFAAIVLRLFGDLGRWEALILVAVTLLALGIIPARAPIVRAAVMALALLGGRALGRRWDPVAALAWTAVGVLIWRPTELWSMGFQLSFGLVLTLIVLGPVIQRRLFGVRIIGGLERPPSGWRWALSGSWNAAKGLIGASVLCWLIALPLTLHHTGMLSPLAIPATILTLPLIALTLLAAYTLAIIGLVLPAAADIAAGGLAWLARTAHDLVTAIDAAPWASFELPRVSLAWTIGATAAAIYIVLRARWRDGRTWALTGIVLGALAFEMQRAPGLRPEVALRIDTLSVGAGTCHLLRSGDQAMLWDCGSLRTGIGRSTIPRALRELGAWKIPLVVISHPNLDHYNALEDVAPAIGAQRIILGKAFLDEAARTSSGPARLLEQLQAQGISVDVAAAGDSFTLGSAHFEFLAPAPDAAFQRINDHSLVAMATAPGGRRLLLTGDVEREAIRWLLESGADLRADAMEIPHHGAPIDAAYALLIAASPRAVVQSSSQRLANHPVWEEARRETLWLQTPIHGAAWVEFLHDG